MKRDVSAEKETLIKSPKSPRAIENELGDMIEFMVAQMGERFKNQVLGELQASTADKFADAQAGNFAAILLRLSRQVQKKLLKQFPDKRIEAMTSKMLGKLDSRSKQEFYARVAKATGIDVTALIAKEGLKSTTNALMLETAQWIKTLRDETFQTFTNNTLFAMSQGDSLSSVVDQFDDIVKNRKNHAKFLARNQVQNYNSITTKVRAQNLGITKAVWETAGDERVRPSHAARDGKEFDLAEGLYSSTDGVSLLPGADYNCRCGYRLVIPETAD